MEPVLLLLLMMMLGINYKFWTPTVKRALHIGKAHQQAEIEAKNPDSDEISQAQLEKLFQDALEAERAEQKILRENWDSQFLELLPDTDPQKNAHLMKKAGINVIEAEEIYPPNIPYTGEQLTYAERTVKGVHTAYVRARPTNDSDFHATFQSGAIIRVFGWTRGRQIGKTDIWYHVKTKTFEGWVWSGSLNSSKTEGLVRMDFQRQKQPGNALPPALEDGIRNIHKLKSHPYNRGRR